MKCVYFKNWKRNENHSLLKIIDNNDKWRRHLLTCGYINITTCSWFYCGYKDSGISPDGINATSSCYYNQEAKNGPDNCSCHFVAIIIIFKWRSTETKVDFHIKITKLTFYEGEGKGHIAFQKLIMLCSRGQVFFCLLEYHNLVVKLNFLNVEIHCHMSVHDPFKAVTQQFQIRWILILLLVSLSLSHIK